ncbi:hypothetical protein K435DRAFT_775627 [Dendrothele bispora CBS 962.96]|uniref:Conserved oligomeric Golgi complex subunit 7 n=1 Tax=Dendrothele bispora (strain CBS 962.96) TaxID=1314807 RepID=A0A4S8MI89_DENBC|nr:hypothetical protein K435DRAFT_775627 [Dendrothele bispora CBS 962.96]
MSLAASSEDLALLEEYDDLLNWINDTLSPEDGARTDSLSNLDQQITQLIASLDIACEDTSSQLERVIDDVSRAVPRLTYDLHFIRDGAITLQNALTTVRSQSQSAIPKETDAALEQLKRLDTMKRNMEAAREVLKEAESWSTLELEVTTLLSERNYAKAASRLSEANKSMIVFQNTPEYDPRKTLLVNLQNQLEAPLSSALVAAINEQDLITCRDFFTIFSDIQRESEFRNYYNGSRRSSLVSMWQNAQLAESTSDRTLTLTFAEFLPKFYASMLALLNQERSSIPSIFPDPALSLNSLISSILSALQPSFAQRLSSVVTHHGNSSLPQLIAALRATEEFAVGVDKIIEKIKLSAVNTSSPSAPSSETSQSFNPSHGRRRSMRMSISFRSMSNRSMSGGNLKTTTTMDGMDWDQELFQPFLEYQLDYGVLERRLLDHALHEMISSDSGDKITDQARLLRERAVDVFGASTDSLARYEAFTHGYGAVSLVQALDGFVKSFIDMWTADVSFAISGPVATTEDPASEDLSGLDYTAQDWSHFQASLHLLGSARHVSERMSGFEVKLWSNLIETANKFKSYRGDPVNFPVVSSRGEAQILEQSSLNSAELHALLDRADQESSHARESRHSHEPLLTDARIAVFSFAKTCQVSLQGTILSPLRKHLASYASSPIWTAPDTRARTGGSGGINDLHIPTFSLSPSDTIQRVAEGLLNLPRLFEVYADDDALSFSLHTLPYLDAELLRNLPEQTTSSTEVLHNPPSHTRRQSIAYVRPVTLDPETVSTAWLSSLGQSILVHLVSDVLPQIKSLTESGAAQLASDLAYLSPIVRALNVEFDELETWKEYVDLDDEAGKAKMKTADPSDHVLETVSRMRGWY